MICEVLDGGSIGLVAKCSADRSSFVTVIAAKGVLLAIWRVRAFFFGIWEFLNNVSLPVSRLADSGSLILCD
jgi:hypothetical protein